MNRGISTVLDVGVAIVLVGASVAVLAGVPTPGATEDVATHTGGGVAVAGSTMTVSYERPDGQTASVTRTVAGHLSVAAKTRATDSGDDYTTAVERDVAERIEDTGTSTQLASACVRETPESSQVESTVVVGQAPPGDATVDAVVYRPKESTSDSSECDPVVVVRSWSP